MNLQPKTFKNIFNFNPEIRAGGLLQKLAFYGSSLIQLLYGFLNFIFVKVSIVQISSTRQKQVIKVLLPEQWALSLHFAKLEGAIDGRIDGSRLNRKKTKSIS